MKNLEGVLFKAKEKKSDNSPDFNGSILINDQEYWLNGWQNTSKDGNTKYMRLSMQAKEAKDATKTKDDYKPDNDSPFV